MRFWENVQTLLDKREKSMRSLARDVGVSAAALSNYGRGAIPSLDVAARIAQALEVPLDWLVWGSPDEPPPAPCPAPHEHTIYREVVVELELHEVVKLSRLGTLDLALRISDFVNACHPTPVSFEELRSAVEAPSLEDLDASLIALKRRRIISETASQGGRSFSLRSPVGHFSARESGDFTLHVKRAVRMLFSGILPALERGGDAGHLLTVAGRLPRRIAQQMARELHETVKARSREYLANDGDTELYLVFGVAMGDNSDQD